MRVDMAAGSFWAFSQAAGFWAPGAAVRPVSVRLGTAGSVWPRRRGASKEKGEGGRKGGGEKLPSLPW